MDSSRQRLLAARHIHVAVLRPVDERSLHFVERCPVLNALLEAEKQDHSQRFPRCERCGKSLRMSTAEEYDGYCNEFCQTSSAVFQGKSRQPPKIKATRAPRKPKKLHQNPNYGFYQRQKATPVA
jgi:hypothetical protein